MNRVEFTELVCLLLDECVNTLRERAKCYAKNDDAFHNFNVAARKRNTTPEDALMGMKVKHTVSIDDIVEGVKSGELPELSVLEEKIKDEINYLLLLYGMITERITKKSDEEDKEEDKEKGEP